ncbi:MAG: hypothetical protein HS130_02535 [Deltaproteobacteria bacterium]|nr:hypothetical protein [Deltaproteobacteria bacterium]MCL4873601.1 hypothetical protein [bacterium]
MRRRNMLARISAAVVLTVAVVAAVFYFNSQAVEAGPEKAAIPQVEPSRVCMVQDRVSFMGNIPVEIEGKTYFGCCPNCVGRLMSAGALRHAIDPATGNVVDKAESFIVSREDGTVMYFESEKTARDFHKAKESD